jgi:hypothetical protein
MVRFFGPTAEKLRKAIDSPRTSQSARFEELRKVLDSHRHQVPEGLADSLTLDAVTDLLRITRNEAGHPTGTRPGTRPVPVSTTTRPTRTSRWRPRI